MHPGQPSPAMKLREGRAQAGLAISADRHQYRQHFEYRHLVHTYLVVQTPRRRLAVRVVPDPEAIEDRMAILYPVSRRHRTQIFRKTENVRYGQELCAA